MTPLQSKPGVYCFWNKINNKVYVGSAQDLEIRLNQHLDSVKSNSHLQNALALYGLEAFHISQVVTETHEDALDLEQRCLDYLFGKNKPKYNIADKVGGGCVIDAATHKALCTKGQEWAEISKGSNDAKPRYAINTLTGTAYTFSSCYDAEEYTGVSAYQVQSSCARRKPVFSKHSRWIFSSVSSQSLLKTFESLTELERTGLDKITFVLYDVQSKEFSKKFNKTTEPAQQGYDNVSSSSLSRSLHGKNSSIIAKKYIALITELNGAIVKNPIKQYVDRFEKASIDRMALNALKKTPSYYLYFADKCGISFNCLDQLAKNAVRSVSKRYSFTGSLTKEDLYGYAWEGLLSAISQPKFETVTNKPAYCYTFAVGYQTHALHRKSRVLRVPWDDIKTQKLGTAHLSYSWGNLPEPSYEENPDKALYDLVNMLSETDEKRIIAGKEPSELGKQILKQLTELVNA